MSAARRPAARQAHLCTPPWKKCRRRGRSGGVKPPPALPRRDASAPSPRAFREAPRDGRRKTRRLRAFRVGGPRMPPCRPAGNAAQVGLLSNGTSRLRAAKSVQSATFIRTFLDHDVYIFCTSAYIYSARRPAANANFINGIGSNVLIFLHPNVTDIMFNMFRCPVSRDSLFFSLTLSLSHTHTLAPSRSLTRSLALSLSRARSLCRSPPPLEPARAISTCTFGA